MSFVALASGRANAVPGCAVPSPHMQTLGQHLLDFRPALLRSIRATEGRILKNGTRLLKVWRMCPVGVTSRQ